MKHYWEWCDGLYQGLKQKKSLFICVNTLFFGMLGYGIWFLLHFFCLNSWEWMICFIGYPAMIGGYFGGLLYFLIND